MNTGYQVCKILIALKLHFTSKTYDFFRYNGDVSLSYDTYQVRKDKFFCEKLAYKHTNPDKFIDFAATVYGHAEYPKKLWSSEFLKTSSIETHDNSIAWTDALEYNFKKELEYVMQSGVDCNKGINWALSADEGDIPPLVKFLFQGIVTLEFCCYLDHYYGMTEVAWTKYEDDVFYDQFKKRVQLFKPFLINRTGQGFYGGQIRDCIDVVVSKFK